MEPMAELHRMFVGTGLEPVRRQIAFLAKTHLPVLIIGESGVGKELAAQGLALLSGRSMERYFQVNAATLSDPLAESLLFGHVRGAFTGAVESREGFFEAARGGTLFLDEIADVSTAIQAKLLRILDGNTYTRVGETRPLRVDTRLILATNANLSDLARNGNFRPDLLHRLLGSVLEIPPLRQRSADVPELLAHFIPLFASAFGLRPISIPDASLGILRRHAWSGNVRQLKNFVSLAMEQYPDGVITPSRTRTLLRRSAGVLSMPAGTPLTRKDLEVAIRAADGNMTKAARSLGISRQHVYRLLQMLGARPRAKSRMQTPSPQWVPYEV